MSEKGGFEEPAADRITGLVRVVREVAVDKVDRLFCMVIAGDTSHAVELPAFGHVTIGRATDRLIRVDDATVSRCHARLEVGGVDLWIEDVGSANGTSVNGERVSGRARVQPGDVVTVGDATLLLSRVAATEGRRVLPQEAWRRRLAEQVEQARRFGRPLAVLALELQGARDLAAAMGELAAALRVVDLVGHFAAGRCEVLLPETDRAAAERCLERLHDRLGAERLGLRGSVAVFPEDGGEAAALVDCARERLHGQLGAQQSVVRSAAMARLVALCDRVAPSMLPVLLLGETGVGKEVLAERIHAASARSSGPLVRVNCATLVGTLIDSELFGHEKGAFTGAIARKVGWVEQASGGTLFLDEIGELPRDTQAKLLRVLEEKIVVRLGGERSLPVDVRIVAATNRNLLEMADEGAFRSDLLYRFNAVTIVIPPLRDRTDDVVPLAEHFVALYCRQAGRRAFPIELGARVYLEAQPWPGNVRELRNVIERAVLLASDDGVVRLEHLRGPAEVPVAQRPRALAAGRSPGAGRPTQPPSVSAGASTEPVDLAQVERLRLVRALEQTGGNRTHAARLLDIQAQASRHQSVRPGGL